MPQWFIRDDRDREIIEDLENGKHSDRALAIMAGSFIEDGLKHALKRVLSSDEKAARVFVDTAFARNITLGYLLQLYSADVRWDLDRIRDIRNEFAHRPEPLTFDKPPISDHMRSLKSIARLEIDGVLHGGATPFEAFLAGGPPVSAPTNNRDLFLMTVQILIMLMGLLCGPTLRVPEF
ncbi:hypothetical protein [Bradyrhizobium sp. WSM1417]|uniref:hypothetical protein n=1 Tax=Bradyrhizobium sp. WSM1417 TaxID=754500 RepID=UPI00047F2C14|nr:hypothetical protein [Bradyrhizobium sp. WSM1417]